MDLTVRPRLIDRNPTGLRMSFAGNATVCPRAEIEYLVGRHAVLQMSHVGGSLRVAYTGRNPAALRKSLILQVNRKRYLEEVDFLRRFCPPFAKIRVDEEALPQDVGAPPASWECVDHLQTPDPKDEDSYDSTDDTHSDVSLANTQRAASRFS